MLKLSHHVIYNMYIVSNLLLVLIGILHNSAYNISNPFFNVKPISKFASKVKVISGSMHGALAPAAA